MRGVLLADACSGGPTAVYATSQYVSWGNLA